MNKLTQSKIKLISSLLCCLISLIMLAAITFAWFSKNDNVAAGGMQIGITNDSLIAGYSFYRIDEADAKGGHLFIEQDKSTATLGTYDVLKQNYQLLLKVQVKKSDVVASEAAVNFKAQTSTDYFLGNTTEGNYRPLLPAKSGSSPAVPDDDGKNYTNALTSVAGVVVFYASEITEETLSDGSTAYRITDFPSDTRIKTFIDKEKLTEADVKPQSISLTAQLAEDETQSTLKSGEEFYEAFFMLTYDPTLVFSVVSANFNNSSIFGENGVLTVPFVSDFSITIG